MKRGDFVIVALAGDFGNPRPALVIQLDLFEEHATATLLLVTSFSLDIPLLRVTVDPDELNGLGKRSHVQIDKAMTVRRERIGKVIGRLDAEHMLEVERRLALFFGIAK